MQTFKDLITWQEAMNLVVQVYRLTKSFPREEIYGLTSQMRRAAVSIPANIAEGYGRESRKEYLRFLAIAKGSLTEVETHILIAERVGYLNQEAMNLLQPQLTSVGKLLTALRKSLV